LLHVEQLECRLTPTLITLGSFVGANGANALGGVIMDSSGNLYGSTVDGGASNNGTIFELVQGSGTITPLVSLNGFGGSASVMDSGGNLYGTTSNGGASNDGTIIELAHGSGTITTLASFDGTNGKNPSGALIMDSSGNLYGTTGLGSASGGVTVFELVHGSGTITTLASDANLINPSGVVVDSSGNLYGTTAAGGAFGDGTVFELAHGSSTITVLASFDGTDGANPISGVIVDSSGNLYGTTDNGGASVGGTIFELAHGSGTITTLASFDERVSMRPALIMDSSGNLYGTTGNGGPSNEGTIFELAQGSSTITTLASFNGGNGANPICALIMDSRGNLYGTTYFGGASDEGTVFEFVAPISLSPTSLPAAAVGTSYTQALTARGGTAPYTFAVTAGSLPAGLSLSTAGVLSGTPTTIGSSAFTVTATDSTGMTGNQQYTLLVEQPAARLGVTGFSSPTAAGTAGTLTVTALNADGSTDTGYLGTVHFTSSDPLASLPADYSFTLADHGVHSFPVTLFTVGTRSLTATDTGSGSVTGSEAGITVTPAAAAELVFSGVPRSTTAGSTFALTVTAEDPYGNTVPGYMGTVHFTSSDPQAVLPADYTFTTGDAGKHAFFVTLKTAGSQSVRGMATGSVNGGEARITVTPAPATGLVLGNVPATTTAGSAFTFTVALADPYGNIVPGYTGTVHFTSSDPKAVLPANYTFTSDDASQQTFFVTLETAGTQSLTATDTMTSSLTGTANGIAVNPAVADHLAFVQQPTDTVAGATINPPVMVQVLDRFGNLTSTAGVTLTLGGGPGGTILGGTRSHAASGGLATFNDLSITQAGTGYTLMATVPGLHSAVSTAFAVRPAAADHLAFLQPPAGAMMGQPINGSAAPAGVQVGIFDRYNNLVTADAGDTVTLAIGSGSGGNLNGARTQPVHGGVAAFSDLSIDMPGGYTFQASSTTRPGLAAVASPGFAIQEVPMTFGPLLKARVVRHGRVMPGHYIQVVSLYSSTDESIGGPFTLELEGLPARPVLRHGRLVILSTHIRLLNASGYAADQSGLSNPFVYAVFDAEPGPSFLAPWSAGTTFLLQFSDPLNRPILYTPLLLARASP
jgi:uncharacterized repeat protein (TIGR03803 family)